mmetsp:Transcript_13421/g.25191  ORF Transcript_13421/g.25191 Transcript_13421/m.25191 type:complete len:562 (+) Transcript_13421:146-1831(+)
MDPKLRKRGWSISSNSSHPSPSKEHHNQQRNSSSKVRPRSNTDQSEDTLDTVEKMELLQSFPTHELDDLSHNDTIEKNISAAVDSSSRLKDDDVIEMFGDSDSELSDTTHELQPKKKRIKLDSSIQNLKAGNDDYEKEARLQQAKNRLSKWAKRLFDPDRPRGLVEAPETIPLNDEFLSQFGKREKEFYEKTGNKIELEDDNLDDMDAIQDGENNSCSKDNGIRNKGTKVKISNLAYTTTEQAVTQLCETFGPIIEVKMPMDDNNSAKSKGRAYITFQLPEHAESIVESMNEKKFEGRILRINLASDRPQSGRDSLGGIGSGGGGKQRAASSRYFVDDITTKCFRCGQVGHTVSSCTNEEMSKPCPLCAKTGHDSYACPLNKICFNCGVPGHINRECPERRGMPRRMVCGTCFISGHHKWECRERVYNIPSYGAKCLVCGKDGHFMCDSMKWFFGLRGIFCFNCGRKGHHGSNCDRPTVDECARNPDLVMKELERAEAKSIEDEMEELRQRRRDEQRQRDRGRQGNSNDQSGKRDRERAKSQPASSRFRPSNNQSSKYGRL